MWEVLTQKDPWGELPDMDLARTLLHELRADHRPPMPPCTPELAALLCAAWATSPRARPTFADIVASPALMLDDAPATTSV